MKRSRRKEPPLCPRSHLGDSTAQLIALLFQAVFRTVTLWGSHAPLDLNHLPRLGTSLMRRTGALIRVGWSQQASEPIRSNVSQPSPDNLVLARVAKRDREALAEVYARFQRPLFRYLFHLLGKKEPAEDVLQEVMVIVWQKAHTFHGTGTVAGWLFRIAHHQAFKALRQDARAICIELEAAGDLADETLEPEADLLRQTTHEELALALACLAPEHREVLELAFFQDFAGKEIAAIVSIPLGTVKSRLSYARRALKAALLRNGWEGE
jgi:RNA polymerase sigma-70 factor, ECF subfamily